MHFRSLLLLCASLLTSLPLAAASDTPTSLAASFLQGFTKKRGPPTEEAMDRLLFGAGKTRLEEAKPGVEQMKLIRSFVKEVSPFVGKPIAWHHDAPLHDVLLRAEDLLGVEYDENQDSHPHVKGKEIIGAIKKFHDAMHRQHIAALAAARLGVQQKDEV